jgi:hypothetical protein
MTERIQFVAWRHSLAGSRRLYWQVVSLLSSTPRPRRFPMLAPASQLGLLTRKRNASPNG